MSSTSILAQLRRWSASRRCTAQTRRWARNRRLSDPAGHPTTLAACVQYPNDVWYRVMLAG